MTYLNLVNNVLRRLREDEVSNVQDTAYSKMVGDFVNDAKRMVEDSWDWSALRTTLSVDTESGTFSYILTGSENRVKVLYAYNDTQDVELRYQTPIWFDQKYMMSSPEEGSPEYYVFNGVDANGDTQVDVYPKPDGIYTLRFNVIQRQDDLTSNTDSLSVPAMPVIHLAVALLARERGETGGTSAPEYFSIADKYLSDAIALDAQKHPEEVIWYTP
ncbi:MAG: hypothetical protein VW270_13450 [Candidatus Poseidoniales archaeon]